MSRLIALLSAFLALPAHAAGVLLATPFPMACVMNQVLNPDSQAVSVYTEWRIGGMWVPIGTAPYRLEPGEAKWLVWPIPVRPASIRVRSCFTTDQEYCSVSNVKDVP